MAAEQWVMLLEVGRRQLGGESSLLFVALAGRQADPEGCAAIRSAAEAYGAALQLDQLPDDRQAEPAALLAGGGPQRAPIERLPDVCVLLWGNARPAIADL